MEEMKKAFPDVVCEMGARGIVSLRGDCGSWDEVVDAGHLAAKQPGVKSVVSHLTVNGASAPKKDYAPYRAQGLDAGQLACADVLIIGAGIIGCAAARALSKYKLDIVVVEAGDDVATGASKANNGNIHPGHAVKPGTLKAKLNVKGNRMYTDWARELGFDLVRCGAMGAVTDERLVSGLEQALAIAKMNGVESAEIVDGKRACELEGGFARMGITDVVAALWLPSMGLVEPYQVARALAENAIQNGARFIFDATVCGISNEGGKVQGALTSKGFIKAKYVVNCAGVHADDISGMAGDECYTIHPRKGVIAILDKDRAPDFDSITEVYRIGDVAPKKNSESKGGGMCKTPEGNVLMGPSATEIPDKEDLSSTPEDLAYAMARGGVAYSDIIRFFAGNRPADYMEDFFIEMSPVASGFVNVGAIQSPGLAAAPAIAEMVEGIVSSEAELRGEPLQLDECYDPIRKRPVEFRKLSAIEQDELIKKDPSYGRIVCRCETITEGEIIQALKSPIPPRSIDAVKRSVRAGMGRCQGGFCQLRVMEIMARETGVDWQDITLKGSGSNILVGENRKEASGK